MITVLAGENSFALQQALSELVGAFDGSVERVDGANLEAHRLADLFTGVSLFAPRQLVVIQDLSQNTELWSQLPSWLERTGEDASIVLIEPTLDKRTTVYKTLQKAATIQTHPMWTEKDRPAAIAWVIDQAKQADVTLDRTLATRVVERAGLDQWALAQAVEKLALLDDITLETIDDAIDGDETANVFQLLDLALDGNRKKVSDMLSVLELQEDPYRLFGLLSGQVMQLVAVATAKSDDTPAKDFAIPPFVISRLQRHAKKLGRSGVAGVVTKFAAADADLKSSRGTPWLVIEKTLLSL